MKEIGYVHFGGRVGDLVRIDVVRRFFEQQGLAYREFAFTHERPRIDIVREILSPTGLKHLTRKLFLSRSHQLLNELKWSIEAHQWEASIQSAAQELLSNVAGVRIFHAETLTAGIACLKVKQAAGTPFVFDMHGIVAEEAKLTNSSEWVGWTSAWERRVVEGADFVIVVSPLMKKYVSSVYKVPESRLLYIPNGSDETERQAVYQSPMTVVYAGNFAPFENILEYVRTAEIGAGPDNAFWLLGDGGLRNEVFDYVNTKFVTLNYWGRKPRAVALDYCAQAQVGFAGQTGALDLTKDYPRQLGCPIKLFDYAACGLPFVAPKGEWSALLTEADCAIVVEECEAKAFLDGIHRLRDRQTWERMARNGKALIRNRFSWNKVLMPLAELYKEN